jgi:hypothetical protein
VKGCKNCYNKLQDPPKIEIKQWPPSKYAWERIHVYFLDPMNKNYYFVLIDAYSKWPQVLKMKDIRTKTTIYKLTETFSRYDLPRTIVSDNGPQFTAQEFKKYVERH